MWCSRLFPLYRNVFKVKAVSSPWSARELERHRPLWQWWEPLWNGVNSAQGQGCSKNSSAQNPLSHSLPHPPAQGQQDTLSHHCRQTLIPNPQNPSGEKLLHPQDVFRSLLGLKQSLNKKNIIIQGEAQLHPDGTIYLSYKDRYILHGLLFLRAHTQAIFSLQWGCPNKSLTGKQ